GRSLVMVLSALFFFSSRRRHTSFSRDWSSDVCSSDLGIDWLQSIAFGHVDSIGDRVLVIGAGNTAMDCCRSAKRLGGTQVKVMRSEERRVGKECRSGWARCVRGGRPEKDIKLRAETST